MAKSSIFDRLKPDSPLGWLRIAAIVLVLGVLITLLLIGNSPLYFENIDINVIWPTSLLGCVLFLLLFLPEWLKKG